MERIITPSEVEKLINKKTITAIAGLALLRKFHKGPPGYKPPWCPVEEWRHYWKKELALDKTKSRPDACPLDIWNWYEDLKTASMKLPKKKRQSGNAQRGFDEICEEWYDSRGGNHEP